MQHTSTLPRLILASFVPLILSCGAPEGPSPANPSAEEGIDSPRPAREDVFTAEQQKALTPDSVLQRLKAGNARFVHGEHAVRDWAAALHATEKGQYPMATILSCMDSRVPVEEVFDMGIGDLFVERVAGNIIDDDLLGSLEYACKVSGTKLIVVMGHQHCGGVKAAIDNVQTGHIAGIAAKIQPAVEAAKNFPGEHTTTNDAYVDEVGRNNVRLSIATIGRQSSILKAMIDAGHIRVVGAYYNMHTGEVAFME